MAHNLFDGSEIGETFALDNVLCDYATADTLHCQVTNPEILSFEAVWVHVPLRLISEDSEVVRAGDTGTLIVQKKFAQYKGWTP